MSSLKEISHEIESRCYVEALVIDKNQFTVE